MKLWGQAPLLNGIHFSNVGLSVDCGQSATTGKLLWLNKEIRYKYSSWKVILEGSVRDMFFSSSAAVLASYIQ